jgi:hypothetical protein
MILYLCYIALYVIKHTLESSSLFNTPTFPPDDGPVQVKTLR